MEVVPSQDSVALRFAELLRDLEQRSPVDTETAMSALTHSAARVLPGARFAGITVAAGGEVKTVAATSPVAEKVDDILRRNGEGPCLDAVRRHHPMQIQDVEVERRWPHFCRETFEDTDVRSVLSFELFQNHDTIGALNFYADRPQAFDDESVDLGLILARHTTVAWKLRERDTQFATALGSRDVIGQAKGMLMERFSIDADAAFKLLRRLSQESNRPLVDLARQLTESRPSSREPTQPV